MNFIDLFNSSDKKIIIFGAGTTGKSVLAFLKNFPCKKMLIDSKKPADLSPDIGFHTDDVAISSLDNPSLIIKSPGIKPDHPFLKAAIQKEIPIVSEIEIARSFFKGKIVAITGTDGKSTTTALTHHLISGSFPDAKLGGNIGLPFIDFCKEDISFAVLELSSYQLDDSSELNVNSSALLNIAPDHLERHGTMENYLSAKIRIANKNDKNHNFILNSKLKDKINFSGFKCKMLFFGESRDADSYYDLSTKKITTAKHTYDYSEFPLEGKHNVENLSAAILLAESAECNPLSIQENLKTFKGLNFRFQLVGEKNGTKFINDSKSTNIHSMLSGIAGIPLTSPVIIILGGRPKKEDISPLIQKLLSMNAVSYLYGEAESLWKEEMLPVLKEKLIIKKNLAEVIADFKDTVFKNKIEYVIFSPACASWDQYSNFEERGRHFNQLIEEI